MHILKQLKEQIRMIRIAWLRFKSRRLHDIDVPLGTVVVVAPHPDDEVMGCGGLIQRLTKSGNDVHIIFMTGGEGSHRGCCNLEEEQLKSVRRKMAQQIDSLLGVEPSRLHFLDYPDGGIRMESSEAKRLSTPLCQLNPTSIFVPHWGEGWPDHVNTRAIVNEIVGNNVAVYEYCVWLWYYNVWHLDWHNAFMLRMTKEEHQRKMEAIEYYVTPKASCGKPWSGVLPKVFISAVECRDELFFKVR